MAGQTWRLGRRPALDGLRGVAILLVLLCHAQLSIATMAAGSVGVTVFFTLSGFLITRLLVEEVRHTGRLDLLAFARRRAVRLLPAFYVCVVAVFLVTPVPSARSLAALVLYVSNWDLAMGGWIGWMGHAWSLAIEEQFYLLWPLLILAVSRSPRRWHLAVGSIAVAGILYAIIARLLLWDGGDGLARIYFGLDTHLDGLLWGALLAVAVDRVARWPLNRWCVLAAGLGVAVVSFFGDEFGRYVVATTVAPLATAVLILGAVTRQRSPLLAQPALLWLGRRSYGLYLWHYPLFYAVRPGLQESLGRWGSLLAVTALALVAAGASWRYVEKPMLDRWSRKRVEPVSRQVSGTGPEVGNLKEQVGVYAVESLGRARRRSAT